MKVIRLFVFKEKNRGKKFFMVFTLNFYFMRKFLLFGIVSCLILAGCNTKDELLSATYTDPISPIGKNFVLFSNNTSLMIGNNAASQLKPMSILRGKSDLFTNEARNLSMEDAPSEIPAGDNYLEVSGELVIDNENKYDGMNLYVSSGGTLRINSDIAKTSSITVMPGGKMVFSGKNISNVYLLCYGTLEITNASVSIAKDAVIKVAGDFNVSGNLELKDGKMYVAGDLVCGSFAADKTASVHKLAVLHVIGNFKQKKNDVYADQIKFSNNAIACVEGTLTAENVILTKASNLLVDCKMVVNRELNVSSSTLNADYIDMRALSSYAFLESSQVNLRAGGIAAFSNIYPKDGGVYFNIVGEGNALIDCVNFRMDSKEDMFNIDSRFYLNYQKTYIGYGVANKYVLVGPGKALVDNEIEVSTDLINIKGVEINASDFDDVCNPGFSDPDTDIDQEIVLEIPDGIEEEWFLKADDFAIRVNGQYQENIKVEDGVESLTGIKITEQNLKITVSGVENLSEKVDYTYEVWLWVSEETWTSFSDAERAAWIAGDGHGSDISELCTVSVPEGFRVVKNVYKGLSGQGDTPYIKVSLHIVRSTAE